MLAVALLSAMLLATLGTALSLLAAAETRISVTYRDGYEALYAADTGVELARDHLASLSDWSSVIDGTVTSPYVDGVAGEIRRTPAGLMDLAQATNLLLCGRFTTCSEADVTATTRQRPWGANNPRWRLYVYGSLRPLVGGDQTTPDAYVVVWVASAPDGRGGLVLRSHAYGRGGTQRAVQVSVAREEDGTGLRRLDWHEVR